MHPENIKNSHRVPLSESYLWKRQTEFYQSKNILAWDSRVPYYATCNPYIANAYANTIVRYIQEIMGQAASGHLPCYIVELGAGHGVFTFYLLRSIEELINQLGLKNLPFVYVATDCVPANVDFWKGHPQFQDYISRGKLDFAVFDLLKDTRLQLQVSGNVIDACDRLSADPPMVLIANYLFDSLPQDLFRVVDGEVFEGMAPLEPDIPESLPDNTEISLAAGGCPITYEKATVPRYEAAELNEVLERVLARSPNQFVLMSSYALRGLQKLLTLAGDRCLLIATDKAYGRDAHLYSQNEPGLVFHDAAFSMMVDFGVIGEFFRQYGGDCFRQTTTKAIGTSVFLSGASFNNLVETRHAAHQFLDRFSPGDLFGLYSHFQNVQFGSSLNVLVSFLNMTGWDPYVFESHFHHILSIVESSDTFAIQDLVRGLPQMAENYYQLQPGNPFFENIGVLLQKLKLFEKAIEFYERALELCHDKPATYYNLGLCCCALADMEKAKTCFAKAIQLKPDHILARGWLQMVEDQTRPVEESPPQGKQTTVSS